MPDRAPTPSAHDAARAFEQLFEASPLHGILFRPIRDDAGALVDLRIVRINRALTARPLAARDTLLDRSGLELFGAEVMAPYLRHAEEVLKTGEARVFETHFAPNGRDYQVTAVPLGELYATLGLDVTAEHHARAEAEEARDRYELIANNAADVVFRATNEGLIEWISESIRSLTGFDAEGLIGRPFTELVDPEDVPVVRATQAAVLDGEERRLECRCRTADGGRRWVSVLVRPVRDAEGRVVGRAGGARDVQAEHEAREALARTALAAAVSDQRFREALDAVTDVVCVYDVVREQGRFVDVVPVYFNRAAHTHWGMKQSIESVVGKRLFAELPDARPLVLEIYREVVESGVPFEETRRFVAPTGIERWLDLRVGSFPGGLIHTSRDVTAERQLREDLLHAQRVGRTGSITWEPGGDVRRELTAWSREMFELHGRDPDGNAPNFEEYLRTLRPEHAERVPLVRSMAGATMTVVVAGAETPQLVRVDREQLEDSLLRLMMNACEATPADGRLTIALDRVELGAREPSLRPAVGPGSFVRLTVRDTGRGIAPEVLPRIFEPFFSTKHVSTGAGLGLSSVEGAMAQAGGAVRVETELGRGTTVALFLPAAEASKPSTATATSKPVVLVVDDDSLTRSVVARSVRRLGYEVVEADGADAALAVAADGGRRLDVLLVDAVMPATNGLELAERLRLVRPEVGVVLMSAYGRERAFGGRPLPTGTTFVAKPFARDALKNALARACSTGLGK